MDFDFGSSHPDRKSTMNLTRWRPHTEDHEDHDSEHQIEIVQSGRWRNVDDTETEDEVRLCSTQ